MGAARAAGGITRSQLIVRGALATGALYGAGAVAPFVERALAVGRGGDLAVVDFALTLERVEAAFYKKATATPGLPPDVKRLLAEIATHENDHVQQLTQTLQQVGATPGPAPKPSFPGLSGTSAVLGQAVTLEDTGVGAYNGAIPQLSSPDLRGDFGSIVQVEGRHAGALRERAGQPPAPAAFDRALTKPEVLAALRPYGV
jgi:rubrerythrin